MGASSVLSHRKCSSSSRSSGRDEQSFFRTETSDMMSSLIRFLLVGLLPTGTLSFMSVYGALIFFFHWVEVICFFFFLSIYKYHLLCLHIQEFDLIIEQSESHDSNCSKVQTMCLSEKKDTKTKFKSKLGFFMRENTFWL